MDALAVMGFALGMRHGADPDHLAAIDGLTRVRPRTTNGIYFAFGHVLVVVLLVMGIGHFSGNSIGVRWSLEFDCDRLSEFVETAPGSGSTSD
jgi:high-affinity nickel permease